MASQKSVVDIELSQHLSDERIITSYTYDLDSLMVKVDLNHEYDAKSITLIVELGKWSNHIRKFEEALLLGGIRSDHATLICDTLRENQERIRAYANARLLGSLQAESKGRPKKNEIIVFKYSSNGKSDLHEAAIVSGKRVFLKYDKRDRQDISNKQH